MATLFSKRSLVIIISIAIFLLIAYWILPVSIPLILAFITALFLLPVVRWLEFKKLRRNLAVLIVFIMFVIMIGTAGYFIVTKVVTEAIKIGENVPTYINEINDLWLRAENDLTIASRDLPQEFVDQVSLEVQKLLEGMKDDLKKYLNIEWLTKVATNIPGYLVSFIVYLIALFLFLVELPKLTARMYGHMTPKTTDKVKFMTARLSYVVVGFFKAQFLVSLIIFIVCLIGLLFIAPEVALVMAVIIWLIDLIPIIGSIIILAPWAIFHFLTGSIPTGTQLAVLATLLLIIRRTVEPKVMGQHIGLSPLATLIAMYIGLKLFGILGFIIGPLLVISFNTAREAGIIKLNFKI